MIPSPEQHKAALDAAMKTIDVTIFTATRGAIEKAVAAYLSALPEQTDRPAWMSTRFGGSDSNPEKRGADLVAMVDALAERVEKLEAAIVEARKAVG